MSRYILTPYGAAEPAVREIYDDYLRISGAVEPPLWVLSLGHSARLCRAYWEMTKGSLLTGLLPYVLKEMIVFVVSRENGSRYCTACHAHAVLQMDPTLTYADLTTLLDPDSRVPLPPAHRAAVHFAARIARDANAVTDADFAALAEAGFSQAEIHELLAVTDLAAMFNAYTKGLQLPLDPEYQAMLNGH